MTKFHVKDTVLSFDNGILYEAKIMKIQEYGGERKYFIHYNGWARKYDLWMEEDQLANKNDPQAVERLKEAAHQKLVPTGKKGKSSNKQSVLKIGKQKIDIDTVNRGPAPASLASSDPASTMLVANTEEVERLLKESKNAASKRGIELISFDAKAYQRELLQQDLFDQVEDEQIIEKIKLTLSMKKHLLDDWNLITKEMNNRLIRLPKSHNSSVNGILEGFLAKKRQQLSENGCDQDEESNFTISNYEDFLRGLRIQFNRALPSLLLFRQERAQFDLLTASENLKGKSISEIYGAEHLIRFFVRMPKQLSGVVLQKDALNCIFEVIAQLISFMEADNSKYFSVLSYINRAEALSYINCVSEELLQSQGIEDEGRGKRNKKKRNFDDI